MATAATANAVYAQIGKMREIAKQKQINVPEVRLVDCHVHVCKPNRHVYYVV